MAAKVWFKMVQPKSDWVKVSLDGIIDIANIKEEIRNKMKPKLDQYPATDFTISASKADEDVGNLNTEKLDPRDSLESILSQFGIEGQPTVPEAFARNISKKFILHPIHLMHQMQGMHKRQTDVQDAKCKTSCVLTSSGRGYMKPLRPVLLPRLFFAS